MTLKIQDRRQRLGGEDIAWPPGIHSRRRAADELGVEDPDGEWARWREEAAQAVP